jgi:hypothetical protein
VERIAEGTEGSFIEVEDNLWKGLLSALWNKQPDHCGRLHRGSHLEFFPHGRRNDGWTIKSGGSACEGSQVPLQEPAVNSEG